MSQPDPHPEFRAGLPPGEASVAHSSTGQDDLTSPRYEAASATNLSHPGQTTLPHPPALAVDGALYPGFYTWYVFMAALDVLMTRIILSEFFGGYEVNWLAHWIMQNGSMRAATIFKFATVVVVILICEFVGRRDYGRGRRLARWAVAITALPVLVSFAQLIVDLYAWFAHGDMRLQTAPGGPYR